MINKTNTSTIAEDKWDRNRYLQGCDSKKEQHIKRLK